MARPELNTDQQIVAALQNGDELAFTTLYDRYFERVYYFAQRYVPRTDAQDVAAEVFLQLWRKRADFPNLEALIRFLFLATRNSCLNVNKHERVREEHALRIANLIESEAEENYWADQELRLHLVQLIERQVLLLPPKTREVFLLSFQEGLKPAQIAERLGVSVKTIKNQKLTGIRLLKAALANHPLGMLLLVVVLEKNFPQG